MSGKAILGIILVVIGVLILAYQGFGFTTREKAADLGPLQITKKEQHTVYLPPVLGVIALGAGIVVLVAGRRSV